MPERSAQRRIFLRYVIKPSHCDDGGVVIQRMPSAIPSNPLAALSGLAMDCRECRALGDDADTRIVGGQSNQVPRALDIARPLREAQSLGIALFAGEAEDGRRDAVRHDAAAGKTRRETVREAAAAVHRGQGGS